MLSPKEASMVFVRTNGCGGLKSDTHGDYYHLKLMAVVALAQGAILGARVNSQPVCNAQASLIVGVAAVMLVTSALFQPFFSTVDNTFLVVMTFLALANLAPSSILLLAPFGPLPKGELCESMNTASWAVSRVGVHPQFRFVICKWKY
jgi:hypothetical protein